MQRITDTTAAAALPAVPTLSGVTGYFNEGVPGVSAPTRFRGWWANMVQEELMSLLTAANITPDAAGTNYTQILQAVRALPTGRLINLRAFNGAGTYAYTATAGTTSVVVEMLGGGGGGGGALAAGSGNASAGTPGNAGSYGRGRFTSGFNGITITVGAGGAGGVGGNGGAGGTSSFGTLMSCPGGPGGQAGSVSSGNASGANGNTSGLPSGATFGAEGLVGTVSLGFTTGQVAFGGAGGASYFGAGAPGVPPNSAGRNAVTFGGGGSGTVGINNSGVLTGGGGQFGLCLVAEYS